MNVLKEVNITRIFNAPRELAYKAWTTPELMQQWWGPHGFTNPACEMDVRVGGSYRICMDAPNFPGHWTIGKFLEVVPAEKLVFTGGAFIGKDDVPGLEVLNTVIFEEDGNKTRLILNAKLLKLMPELRMAGEGMEPGWKQSLEKLEALLITLQ